MRKMLLALLCFSVPSFAADKPLVIESGKIKQLPASTTLQINGSGTGAASINIPHGTAPTSPTNGDCWTTTSGLFCRINGVTAGPYGAGASGAITSTGLTMSPSRVLGRTTAGTGAIEEISVGSGLVLSGGTLSTSTGGGGNAAFNRYTVATAGDAFINVSLDADDGFAYEVFVRGRPSVNANVAFLISNDDCATVKTGASDYRSNVTASASSINIGSGGTVGAGKDNLIRLLLTGMNVAANGPFTLIGENWGVASTGTPFKDTTGGGQNALADSNWNCFRVIPTAGTMDGYSIYVRRAY